MYNVYVQMKYWVCYHFWVFTGNVLTCLGLLQAFDVVEKSYFESIDDALAEKAHLSNYLPHDGVRTHAHARSGSAHQLFRLQGPHL